MINSFKVLIAEDEEDIAEILSFIVKSSLGCEVILAPDGKEAIDLLSKGDINLIICDYNMPTMKGGEVYKYILESSLECKFVMCSTEAPEKYPEFKNKSALYGFIQKPDLIAGSKAIMEKIISEYSLLVSIEMESYTPISAYLLYRISVLPSDIALKLSPTNHVKVFNKGEIFDELDLIKYTQTNDAKLVAINADFDAYIDGISASMAKKSESLNPHSMVDGNIQIHSLLASAFKQFGLRDSLIRVVDDQINEVYNLCKTSKPISILFKKLLRSKESYISKHSFMLAAISLALAEEMEWSSVTTGQKLVMASLFHDIFLDESFTSEMINVKPEQRNLDFLAHPQLASDLLDKIPHIHPGTSRIILEHHEVGDGEGFNRGLAIWKTTPLTQVFTFSHYVVDCIYQANVSGEFDEAFFYTKMQSICLKSNKYKRLLELFRSLNFFQ